MGLSLHYSAKIKSPEDVDLLSAEVAAICRESGWKFQLWDSLEKVEEPFLPKEPGQGGDYKGVPLKGIVCTIHEKCEPVFLTFAPSGYTTSFINLKFVDQIADINPDLVYTISVKTQFAGPQIHIVLVNLLRYLGQKYCSELQVSDEGGFWETNDEAVLLSAFQQYDDLLNMVAATLQSIPLDQDDTPEGLARKIQAMLSAIGRK